MEIRPQISRIHRSKGEYRAVSSMTVGFARQTSKSLVWKEFPLFLEAQIAGELRRCAALDIAGLSSVKIDKKVFFDQLVHQPFLKGKLLLTGHRSLILEERLRQLSDMAKEEKTRILTFLSSRGHKTRSGKSRAKSGLESIDNVPAMSR